MRGGAVAAFEDLKADYAGAKSSRFGRVRTGFQAAGSSADYHLRNESDYFRMIEKARDFARNDVAITPMLRIACDNVLQDGFVLDPRTGDKGLDTALFDLWEDWSNDPSQCDVAGESTFDQLVWQALWALYVDGDCLVLPLESGEVQLVEAHRLRTPKGRAPNVVCGVELDAVRRRVSYHVTKEDLGPGELVTASKMRRYPAYVDGLKQVFHVFDPVRVSQTRGVTAFAPVFDTAGMFEDINFAALIKQQIAACVVFWRSRDVGAPATAGRPGMGGEQRVDAVTSQVLETIQPGMSAEGAPGEKLEAVTPNIPGDNFEPHMRMTMRLMSLNFGLPLMVATLDGSETNFTGWRGAMDQAKLGFRRLQRLLASRPYSPVYTSKVRQWALKDAALARALAGNAKLALRHGWRRPVWPYIEPLTDASADLLRRRNGLASPRQIAGERGQDWEVVAGEIVDDNAMAIELAMVRAAALNKKYPDQQVHWRDLLSLPTPDGVQTNLAVPAKVAGPGSKGNGA